MNHYFLTDFKTLPLTFKSLILMCLSVNLFGFILLGLHKVSFIYKSIPPPSLVSFSAIISFLRLSSSSILFSFGTPIMFILVSLLVSHKCLVLFSLLLLFFSSVLVFLHDLPLCPLALFSTCLSLLLNTTSKFFQFT